MFDMKEFLENGKKKKKIPVNWKSVCPPSLLQMAGDFEPVTLLLQRLSLYICKTRMLDWNNSRELPALAFNASTFSVFVDVLNNITSFPEAPDLPYVSPDSSTDK